MTFKSWIAAVHPRFPAYAELALEIGADPSWPDTYDKAALSCHLRESGRDGFIPILSEALEAYALLCYPDAPIPEEQRLLVEWHTPKLVSEIRATQQRHNNNPHIRPVTYRWKLGQRLAEEMDAKVRILIDTCHWGNMCDMQIGKSVPPVYQEILFILRNLAANDRAICPITPGLVLELLTQTDQRSRRITISLMEELSRSVCLPHLDQMEKLELRSQAFDMLFGIGSRITKAQVWTKAAFVFGESWPSPTSAIYTEQDIWFVQKSCLDSMWTAPLTHIINLLGTADTRQMRKDFADELNADKDTRVIGDFTFERNRALAMTLKLLMPTVHEVAQECEQHAATIPGFTPPAQRTQPDPRCLPSVQVLAGIDALIRTSGRRYRPNDMFDLFHAAAAIPYCQAFFCDKPFANIVTDKKLRFDEIYNVKVLADLESILAFLKTI